jgi:catechol 2,3-dioxygenase-like lactoylglutathione lyase family enzyme
MIVPGSGERALISFVFLDVTDVSGARRFFEEALGLFVAENRFHPPHHIHGLVKYDAGSVLLCLNKARPGFDRAGSDYARVGLVTGDEAWRSRSRANPWIARIAAHDLAISADNHAFPVRHAAGPGAAVAHLDFAVRDLGRTQDFFARALGLDFGRVDACTAEAQAGPLRLRFRRTTFAPDRHRPGVFLTVLHSSDVERSMAAMSLRGVTFLSAAQDSRIGRTVRFADPDGHHYCLYQPSAESLGWESGTTLRRLLGAVGPPQP